MESIFRVSETNGPQAISLEYGDYIAHSLQGYRDGRREHALMSSQAAELTDQQIADLGAYFGSSTSQLHDLKCITD